MNFVFKMPLISFLFPHIWKAGLLGTASNMKKNLTSGFCACGIVALNRQEVLNKIPGQSSGGEASTSATVSDAMLDLLGSLRYVGLWQKGLGHATYMM